MTPMSPISWQRHGFFALWELSSTSTSVVKGNELARLHRILNLAMGSCRVMNSFFFYGESRKKCCLKIKEKRWQSHRKTQFHGWSPWTSQRKWCKLCIDTARSQRMWVGLKMKVTQRYHEIPTWNIKRITNGMIKQHQYILRQTHGFKVSSPAATAPRLWDIQWRRSKKNTTDWSNQFFMMIHPWKNYLYHGTFTKTWGMYS